MEAPSPDSSSPPIPPTSSSSNNDSSTSSPSPKSSPSPPTEDSPPPPPPPPPPSSPPPPPNNLSLPSSPPPPPPPQNSKSPAPPSPSDSLPPPASKNLAKSPPSNTPSDSKGDSQAPTAKHADLSLPAVIGIAVGFGLFLALMLIACVCCTKKKKKKPHNAMHYYSDPSGPKGGGYYSSGPPPQWQNGRHDHMAKVPRPPGAGGTPAGGGWHAPPPTLMSSTEISSIYSGPHAPPLPPPSPTIALGFNKSTFTYEELATATNNFSQANLLGQGGFGYVHKGVLPGGKEIAVKKLKSGSGQGEREFQAEVDIISRVHHRHLVSLVGYCIAGSQRLLVYEFVPNKTLEYHLHGKGLPTMDWPTRLKIAIGAAKGLAYLHEDCHPRIIHRDIKSANILLDYKFEAMVADFGLAKLSSENQSHISTRVMGTFGYLAPEYASSGKLTEKSDVFSYGVMLLELITGKRPSDSSHTFMEDSLVDWARPLMTRAVADGAFEDLVDLRLENNYNALEMARMVACANACVRHSARRRPKMSQIVRALDGDVSLDDLNEGVRPGQSILFSSGSDYDSSSYTSNMNRIRKVTLTSPEYSGDYSGPITDFGQRASASSSDGAFSGELNLGGNQRQRPHPLH